MRLLFITYGRVRLNMHGVYHAAKVSQGRLDLQVEASNRLCHSDLTPKSRISLGTEFLLYTCQLALLHRFLIVSVVHGH